MHKFILRKPTEYIIFIYSINFFITCFFDILACKFVANNYLVIKTFHYKKIPV